MSERARLMERDIVAKHCGVDPSSIAPTGPDFAIFVDFSALFQKARTESQTASFGRGLGNMDLLYAHQETVVWRLNACSMASTGFCHVRYNIT